MMQADQQISLEIVQIGSQVFDDLEQEDDFLNDLNDNLLSSSD
jgi:hypothetical protein